MGKKRDFFRNEFDENNILIINKVEDQLVFEIGSERTYDIAEAVAILMRSATHDDPIWKREVECVNIENIIPEKSLFWLTGGYKEWEKLENYNKPWSSCYLDFQEEFGFMVIKIVKRAKTLKDIRDGFLRYLNLPVLYDFAVSKDLVR